MKFSNPLPQPLPKECIKAAKIFQSFVDTSNNGLDGVIPRSILEDAKGFAIFTIVKAGFVLSARAGSGVVIAKLDDGTWSAPSAIGTAGLGVGSQAGAEMTDFLIVLNSRSAIRSFMAAGSLTLGGNMSLALGPLGRNGEASGTVNTKGKMAAMYSYSKTRGLFGGVSIEGSLIVERQDANVQAYDSPVTARMLLGGAVDPPSWANPLIKTLEACTGLPGHRQWINDENARTPGGTYIFGGRSNPSSNSSTPSSFLRKKKKPESPFPPPSWGSESNSDSYFTQDAPKAHSRNMTWDGPNSLTSFIDDDAPPKRFPSHIQHSKSMDTTTRRSTYGNEFYASPTPTQARFPTTDLLSLDDDSDANPFSPPPDDKFRKPFIKPRSELTTPLLPHEGVARAIALYNFEAVEAGDLSFRKGDIITITQKSSSTDDWWTGKAHGRQGLFPANFVEVV